MSSPKLNFSKLFSINFHEIESKAFSKSIKIIIPDKKFFSHSFIMSYINLVFSPMNLSFINPF